MSIAMKAKIVFNSGFLYKPWVPFSTYSTQEWSHKYYIL
jgi:hypothetical protein